MVGYHKMFAYAWNISGRIHTKFVLLMAFRTKMTGT